LIGYFSQKAKVFLVWPERGCDVERFIARGLLRFEIADVNFGNANFLNCGTTRPANGGRVSVLSRHFLAICLEDLWLCALIVLVAGGFVIRKMFVKFVRLSELLLVHSNASN
jgi:hypothetical protein